MKRNMGVVSAAVVLGAVSAARAGSITIDFEGRPEFTAIGEQYAPFGVTFGIAGEPSKRPIIAVTGPVASAFGGPAGAMIDGPMKSGTGGLSDPVGASVTDARDIVAEFTTPVGEVSFWMMDLDFGADWRDEVTVRAYGEGGALLESLWLRAGDPGTGDGVATLIALQSGAIVRVVIDVLPVMGYAIDDVSFTPIPAPGGVGLGLVVVAGLGARRRR